MKNTAKNILEYIILAAVSLALVLVAGNMLQPKTEGSDAMALKGTIQSIDATVPAQTA